jgi:hypothetical protein
MWLAPSKEWFAFLCTGAGLPISGTRRFQLREAGILRAGKLIPWDQIESYELLLATT